MLLLLLVLLSLTTTTMLAVPVSDRSPATPSPTPLPMDLMEALGADGSVPPISGDQSRPVPVSVLREFDAATIDNWRSEDVYMYTSTTEPDSPPNLNAAQLLFHVDVSNFTSAQLLVNFDQRHRPADADCSLAAFDILKPGAQYRLIDNQPIRFSSNGSAQDSAQTDRIALNVTYTVQRWIAHPSRNHGLHVQMNCAPPADLELPVRLRRSLDETAEQWDRLKPTLVVRTQADEEEWSYSVATGEQPLASLGIDSILPRGKRTAERWRRPCQLRNETSYIDFDSLGWGNWIKSPPGFYQNLCQGTCNNMNAQTTHALIRADYIRTHPEQDLRPCCAPSILDSIDALYQKSEHSYQIVKLKNMITMACGCR